MNIKKTAILIINYNNSIDTIECVESLLHSEDKGYDIFILDNNSKQSSLDALIIGITNKFNSNSSFKKKILFDSVDLNVYEFSFLGKNIFILANKENFGFAKGNNFLYKFSSSKYNYDHYLLLNNDTIVTPFFLTKLLITSNNDFNIAAVSCKICDYQNPKKVTFGGYISFFKGSGYFYTKPTQKIITFLSGCVMLIKSTALQDVGLFDENYFLYLEDVDLSLKLIRNGKKLAVNNEVVIFHKESRSTGKRSNLTIYYNVRNRLYFVSKNQTNPFGTLLFYLFFLTSRLISLVFHPNLFKIYKKSFSDFYRRNLGKQIIKNE
jgi:GT2 family glycosyltransferase